MYDLKKFEKNIKKLKRSFKKNLKKFTLSDGSEREYYKRLLKLEEKIILKELDFYYFLLKKSYRGESETNFNELMGAYGFN